MKRKKIKPLVSVIVPVYNQEKFVGRCLRSLLDQTVPADTYEIIVIDDCSVDRTPFALELFHDAIITIRNEKNLGLPASINRGIETSVAEYIVRVDSDDYVNKNFINFLYQYLDLNHDVDAVACDYIYVDDTDEWLQRENCDTKPIACGIMFRKCQLIEIGMYDDKFRCHEDRELRIRFKQKYSIHRLKLPLYRYRRHENNMTNDVKMMEEHEKLLSFKHGLQSKS